VVDHPMSRMTARWATPGSRRTVAAVCRASCHRPSLGPLAVRTGGGSLATDDDARLLGRGPGYRVTRRGHDGPSPPRTPWLLDVVMINTLGNGRLGRNVVNPDHPERQHACTAPCTRMEQ
jgi:hypothetical protein